MSSPANPGLIRRYTSEVLLADLTPQRRLSYFLLGSALALTLGTAQFVVPVKTNVFYDVVGADQDPLAKSLIVVVLIPVLVIYNLLVSALPGPISLVWVMSIVYAGVYGYLYIAFSVEKPNPLDAWLLYYATETKGVLIMPMLWSVVAEVSTSELSKKSYSAIFAIIQCGGIAGSAVAIQVKKLGGPIFLLGVQAVLFIIVAAIAHAGVAVLGDLKGEALLESKPKAEKVEENACIKASKFLFEGVEGLVLLLSRPFAFGIFWVSYATLVPRTVLDYETNLFVYGEYHTTGDRVAFWGRLSLVQNLCILAVTLLGTRQIVGCVGVGGSLLLLPCVLLCSITALVIDYEFWTCVFSGVIASIVAFGLNSPCKEMLFTRTSRDIKYKAKSWSEMWGNNFMKLLGSQINLWLNKSNSSTCVTCFKKFPTLGITIGWVILWIGIVVGVKGKFNQLEKEDKYVE